MNMKTYCNSTYKYKYDLIYKICLSLTHDSFDDNHVSYNRIVLASVHRLILILCI